MNQNKYLGTMMDHADYWESHYIFFYLKLKCLYWRKFLEASCNCLFLLISIICIIGESSEIHTVALFEIILPLIDSLLSKRFYFFIYVITYMKAGW